MSTLKLGISGIRGIWGESLTKENAEQFARLFVIVTGSKKIVVGGDTRASRNELKDAIITGLEKEGCEIIDCGIVPTPTLARMVSRESADGGIMMTASHNPPQWNGLKFFSPQGIFITPIKMNEIVDRYQLQTPLPDYNKTEESIITTIDTATETHVNDILHHIDYEKIKERKFKVVIDMDNGAGTAIDSIFSRALGLGATYLFEKAEGHFERKLEPTPDALTALRDKVLEVKADIGFAQDPDADRLVIVDEKGNVLDEDYTLALAMRHFLSQYPDPKGKLVVAHLSTSRMFGDVAAEFGCETLYTKIGEVNVAEAIVSEDAIFGGEGSSGGVIWPEIGYARDSISGMALILESMVMTGKKISELVALLPRYYSVKEKKEVKNMEEAHIMIQNVEKIFSRESIDLTEGVKVNFTDGWLHARASNTEPIVRFFAEAKTKEQAEAWIKQVML